MTGNGHGRESLRDLAERLDDGELDRAWRLALQGEFSMVEAILATKAGCRIRCPLWACKRCGGFHEDFMWSCPIVRRATAYSPARAFHAGLTSARPR